LNVLANYANNLTVLKVLVPSFAGFVLFLGTKFQSFNTLGIIYYSINYSILIAKKGAKNWT